MSAEMTATGQHSEPPRSDADDTIRRTVKGLISGHGLRVETVAAAVDMTPATLYRRLAGKGRSQAFVAGEVAALADYFNVPVGDLYDGLGGRFGPGSSAGISASRHLTLLPGVSTAPHGRNPTCQPPLLAVVGG